MTCVLLVVQPPQLPQSNDGQARPPKRYHLLGEALTVLADGYEFSGRWHDEHNILRLDVRQVLISRLIKQAFDQIRQAAADNPAVSIRLLSTVGRLGDKMRDENQLRTLTEQAAAVWETARSRVPVSMDLEDIKAAWVSACTALTENSRLRGHSPQIQSELPQVHEG